MIQQQPFEYSLGAVRRAGAVIGANRPWTPENEAEIRLAYAIANSWRDSHMPPMRGIRYAVGYRMRRLGLVGISAARLKRMPAIRGKLLRKPTLNLRGLQDLGGCRTILPAIADVRTLTTSLKESFRHAFGWERDYLTDPKDDGYRSHHIIWFYQGRRGYAHLNGRRIELQVRTQLQHAWATTIEAVGLFRGEELKSQRGSEEWLRLFKLMSAEFAEAEQCALPPDVPQAGNRRREIRDLAAVLKAVEVLETVSHGFAGTDLPLVGYKPSHYLLRYNRTTRTVEVTPYDLARVATRSYDRAEELSFEAGLENESVVLVEVDKINNLRKAYPNYFGDVGVFKAHLKDVVVGKGAVEFMQAPRQPPPTRPKVAIGDPSWLRGARLPKPNLDTKPRRRPDDAV